MTKSKHPGKVVISDLYIHRDAVELLSDEHGMVITDALSYAPEIAQGRANVIKLNQRTGRVSLLAYPNFFDDPFPALADGFRLNSQRLIASKCYRLEGNLFVPLGNVDPDNAPDNHETTSSTSVQRHLTKRI